MSEDTTTIGVSAVTSTEETTDQETTQETGMHVFALVFRPLAYKRKKTNYTPKKIQVAVIQTVMVSHLMICYLL